MQKKTGKTTISPLFTFNMKVGFTFSVLSIFRVRDKLLIFNMILQLWADVKYHAPVWFFAEGERFLSFWRCHRPRKRVALVMWCG